MISLKTITTTIAALGLLGSTQAVTLQVSIEGVKEPYGTVYSTLFSQEDDWLRDGVQLSRKAEENTVILVFEDLEPGRYALYAFHDKNNDEQLNTGVFGKPTEAYGFSNGARGMFGPAKWKDAVFEIGDEDLSIRFKIK